MFAEGWVSWGILRYFNKHSILGKGVTKSGGKIIVNHDESLNIG